MFTAERSFGEGIWVGGQADSVNGTPKHSMLAHLQSPFILLLCSKEGMEARLSNLITSLAKSSNYLELPIQILIYIQITKASHENANSDSTALGWGPKVTPMLLICKPILLTGTGDSFYGGNLNYQPCEC